MLYPGIKFSKLVTNIDVFMILFPGIFNYNLKQTRPKIFSVYFHKLSNIT